MKTVTGITSTITDNREFFAIRIRTDSMSRFCFDFPSFLFANVAIYQIYTAILEILELDDICYIQQVYVSILFTDDERITMTDASAWSEEDDRQQLAQRIRSSRKSLRILRKYYELDENVVPPIFTMIEQWVRQICLVQTSNNYSIYII